MKFLEELNKLDETLCMNQLKLKFKCEDNDAACEDFDEVVECLEDIEQALKVLEIIKVKGLDNNNILMIKANYTYEQYKEVTIELYGCGFSEYAHLLKTKEEYELLKEVLK